MPVTKYGFPELVAKRGVPFDLDFYLLSNEDIGFTANLVTGTNDVEAFALPYPSSLDLFDETIIVHMIQFLFLSTRNYKADTAFQNLAVYLSMLDKEFGATFRGAASDTEDENLKAQFAGPMIMGDHAINVTATASVEGTQRHSDSVVDAYYYPPVPLDLVTPLYVQLVNSSVDVTLATNAEAARDFTLFERVAVRVWFTVRRLTREEKKVRGQQIRFQRLDS